MAARLLKTHQEDVRTGWRFYVYEIVDGAEVLYVGKGCGRRMAASARERGGVAREVARFKREADAYSFERARIAECRPRMNRHPGGNGSRATPARRPRKAQWELDIERIGSRAYAARLLLAFGVASPSKVGEIRRVAYG